MSQSPDAQELTREQKRERLKQLLLERNKPVAHPLSFSQQSLWIQDKFEGLGAVYNTKFGLTLEGSLDAVLLEQVFNRIVARHDSLRSVFGEEEGEPRQWVYPSLPVKMVVIDLQMLPLAEAETQARTLAVAHCRGLFDLSKGPLFRAYLYRLSPERHIQLLVMHHIVIDGWSMGIFVHETVNSYTALIQGQEPSLPVLSVQFSDYARRQREMVSSGGMERTLEFWRTQLAGAPALLDLAIEKPRPSVMGFQGGWETFEIPGDCAKPLRELARTTGSTLFMVLNAAFGVLMARYTGQEDMVIGSPQANRRRPEYQPLIGFFSNMVPLRMDLSGEPSFRNLIGRTKSMCRDAFANQGIPFPYLLQALDLPRRSDYQSLIQVMFALHSFEVDGLGLPGVAVAQFPVDAGTSMFDLYMAMTDKGDYLEGLVEFNSDLFTRQGVRRVIAHMQTLLTGLAAQADQPISLLNVLTDSERADLLVAWQGPMQVVPARSLYEQVAERAAEALETPALELASQVWRYGQLLKAASQVAGHLSRRGVGPGMLVGVASDLIADQVVGLLGILQTGAGFLALPTALEQRAMALPSNCLVLTRSAGLSEWPVAVGDLAAILQDESLAAPGCVATVATAPAWARAHGEGLLTLSHQGLQQRLLGLGAALPLAAGDRVLSRAAADQPRFLWEVLGTLLGGATLVVAPCEPAQLHATLSERRITACHLAPYQLSGLAADSRQADEAAALALRWVSTDGDGLQGLQRDRFLAAFPTVALWIIQDQPEAGIAAAVAAGVALESPLPFGRPLGETRIYVLNRWGNLAPQGVLGQFFIESPCLASQIGSARVTADRLRPCPFGSTPGVRMLATGRKGRHRPDGCLAQVGRRETEVNHWGSRFDLTEVRLALLSHPNLEAVEVVVDQLGAGSRLVALFTVNPDVRLPDQWAEHSGALLRAFVAKILSGPMVPSAFVELERFPLNADGSLDQAALQRQAKAARDVSTTALNPPRTDAERAMQAIWAELLSVNPNEIGRDSNFFELGGRSLLAVQLLTRTRASFGMELTLEQLFATPQLGDLVALMAGRETSYSELEQIDTSWRTESDRAPLSLSQQRIWFLDLLEGQGSAFNMYSALEIKGHLDVQVLEAALADLVERHEGLRMVIGATEGVAYQQVIASYVQQLTSLDLSGLDSPQRAAVVKATIHRFSFQPINWASLPVLHTLLLRVGPQEHILLLLMHHIFGDGWVLNLLSDECGSRYYLRISGMPLAWAPLPLQYADYARWQRSLPDSYYAEKCQWWAEALEGMPPVLSLPLDHNRPALQTYNGAVVELNYPNTLVERLEALGNQHQASLYMVMLATFNTLLYRYTNQTDFGVGSAAANRTRHEFERMSGLFMNAVVMRTPIRPEQTFLSYLAQVRATTLGALAHQDVPFELLTERLAPERNTSHALWFQVALILNQLPKAANLPGITIRPLPNDVVEAKLDLTLYLFRSEDGILAHAEYNRDLFEAQTMRALLGHYLEALNHVLVDPNLPLSHLNVLGPDERKLLLETWTTTAIPYDPTKLMHHLFEAWAETQPDRLAVQMGGDVESGRIVALTYRELNNKANALAWELAVRGAGAEVPIGIYIDRSPELYIAILGVLKTGAAYIPLDPDYPTDRLTYMLENAQAPLVITRRGLRETCPPSEAAVLLVDAKRPDRSENYAGAVTPDNLIYIIYSSGSTGKPKGIALAHGALLSIYYGWNATYRLVETCTRHIQIVSFSFDMFAGDLARAFGSGGALVVCPSAYKLDPPKLYDLMVRSGIDYAEMVPSVSKLLAVYLEENGYNLAFLNVMVVGADTWTMQDYAQLKRLVGPQTRLYNSYGVTEAAVDSTWFDGTEIPLAPSRMIPIGYPYPNVQTFILDRHGFPVPIGVFGILYLAGPGLARGYRGKPGLTATKFVANPYGPAGSRLYCTNDAARYLRDGNIEFLGRVDNQVKLRGLRIELGEIEGVLSEAEGIRSAAVQIRDDNRGQGDASKHLVAYVAGTGGREVDTAALREYLLAKLPEYMVPNQFMVLEQLPLTPNGKIDHVRLSTAPEYQPDWGQDQVLGEAPGTPAEIALAQIFRDVLGVDHVSRDSNFFSLGGHSLLATRLAAQVRKVFGLELELRQVFIRPTLAALAEILPEPKGDVNAEVGPKPVDRDQPLPLSFAQQRLWFLYRLEGPSSTYNLAFPFRLDGPLDVAALERACALTVSRQESLRTRFLEIDDQAVQLIEPFSALEIAFADLSLLDTDAADLFARDLIEREATVPFNLETGPVYRVTLVRFSATRHLLLFSQHHIVSDGWSVGVITSELGMAYNTFCGQPLPSEQAVPLPELPIQYADYAVWQRNWLQGPILERQLAYWTQQLADAPPSLDLPTEGPRPAVMTYHGALHRFGISASLCQQVRQQCQNLGTTLFMLLESAYAELLGRYSGATDLTIGTPVANRRFSELEPLIGFFVNTLVLRNHRGDETVAARIQADRAMMLGAFDHQDLPFEKLVEVLNPVRDPSRSPLFQAVFVLQNLKIDALVSAGLSVSLAQREKVNAPFDLVMTLFEEGDALEGHLTYNTDLFQPQLIGRMVDHYRHLLVGFCNSTACAATLPILSDAERHQLLVEWNTQPGTPWSETNMIEAFASQVAERPDQVAVFQGDSVYTYAALDRAANQLAHHFRQKGCGLESRIAFALERGPHMIVTLLAILKVGGAYVPLDPSYPKDRLCFMLEDSKSNLVVTETQHEPLITSLAKTQQLVLDREDLSHYPETAPEGEVDRDHVAFLNYTSGTTGRPKAVQISHGNVLRYIGDRRYMDFRPGSCMGQIANPCFDALTYEVWSALLLGGSLCIVDRETLLDIDRFAALIQSAPINAMLLTVTFFNECVRQNPRMFQTMDYVLHGGERASVEHVVTVLREGAPKHLINAYGPTETTTMATYYDATDRNALKWHVPIGRPMADTPLYVVDRQLGLVPLEAPGELMIAGTGLSRGYLNRPGLTAEKFIPNPFAGPEAAGSRMYCSGDLVRWQAEGETGVLVYLGRIGNQVKIRGFRIEPDEIAAVLKRCEQVEDAVVLVDETAAGKRLVAAFTLRSADGFQVQDLRDFLSPVLPDYMMPNLFLELETLPRTPNGKLDHRAILALARKTSQEEASADQVPQTLEECQLQTLWMDLLGLPAHSIGRDSNFFERGGHSLLATRLISAIRKAFSVELPLQDVFSAPSLTSLAKRIESLRGKGVVIQGPVPVDRGQTLPLSFAQERLWFLYQLEGPSATYSMPFTLTLKGAPLDVDALSACFQMLVNRHEALRTVFRVVDGVPSQSIMPLLDFSVVCHDLRDQPRAMAEAKAQTLVQASEAQPFLLETGPLFNAFVVLLDAEESVLHVNMHHIISDGWSIGVLVKELLASYEQRSRGKDLPLAPLVVQYADYAVWQKQLLSGPLYEQQLQFWLGELAEAPTALDLPTKPRPSVQTFAGSTLRLPVAPELTARLEQLAQELGATLFMVLEAGFAELLARYGTTQDLLIGTPIANRRYSELEPLIGFFVNSLVLRNHCVSTDTVRERIGRVREMTLAAFAHQDMPFERLVEAVNPVRDPSRSPLFQVMFMVQNNDMGTLALDGMEITPWPADEQAAKFDITWSLTPTMTGLELGVTYNKDLFDAVIIDGLARHYLQLLTGFVGNPDSQVRNLSLLSEGEWRQVSGQLNATTSRFPSVSDHIPAETALDLFHYWAKQKPDAMALLYDPLDGGPVETCSFAELAQKSALVAGLLQAKGVGLEKRVGLCLPPSCERMMGVFGALASGGAYVPIDPDYPADRIATLVEDAGLSLVLTHASVAHISWPEGVETLVLDRNLLDPSGPAPRRVAFTGLEAAYLIYTSGSTGKPKGIVVPHQGVVNLIREGAKLLGVTPESRFLQMSSFSFDGSVMEWAIALGNGARLILAPRRNLLPGPHLHTAFADWELTHLFASPSWYSAMEPPPHGFPRVALVGGEAGLPQVAARWMAGRLHLNVYGPTETTVICSGLYLNSAHVASCLTLKRPLPLAGPFGQMSMSVVDRWGQPVPVGVAGELWIGGVGVTRGYLNRPGLSASQFVPDAFGSNPGSRLYRSGDLVRLTQLDGQLGMDFVGRIDFQVKLRGQRLELAEIEAVLAETEGVTRAVVLLQGSGDSAFLVAYLQSETTLADPLALAKARLPLYMVPSHVVVLETFPTTSTGKLDLKALPKPAYEARTASAPPETANELALAQIWAQVLGCPADSINRDDNFFELGGHSLLVVRLVNQIRSQFGLEVAVRELFERASLRAQAEMLETGVSFQRSEIQLPEILASTEAEILSEAQSSLWFLEQFEGSGGDQALGGTYNIPAGWRIRGPFDLRVLADVVDILVRRHPILRAAYPAIDGAPAVIQLAPERVALRVLDLQGLLASEAAAMTYVRAEVDRVFSLANGPLFCATVLRLSPIDQILFINQHHIISDGWSMELLRAELIETYTRRLLDSALPEVVPELQYRDFAHWQRQLRERGTLDQLLAWWKTQLADLPVRIDLPVEKPRPLRQTFHGDRVDLVFPDQLCAQLKRFNADHRVTHFMTFHAAVALLLARLSGQSVICIGSPTSGRHHKALESMLGMFVNTLAIPTRIQPADTFASLVERVRQQILSCFAHQDVGLDRVVEVVQPQRDISHPPLFQVMLSLNKESQPQQPAPGITWELLQFQLPTIKFELEWSIVATDHQLTGSLGYNTDLFLPQTALRLSRQLTQLLEQLVAEPHLPWHAANLLTAEERQVVVEAFNANPQHPLPSTTIMPLFQHWVQTQPEATALLYDPLDGGPIETCSYATLARESNVLASLLQQRGAGPETKIGICIPPSIERIVAVWGVLMSGAVYVPIDPEYPADRISAIVADCGLSLLLTSSKTSPLVLPHGLETLVLNRADLVHGTPREVAFSGSEAAYLIFTSGSTGKPKGIVVPHLGLVNLTVSSIPLVGLTPTSRFLQMCSFVFDVAVWEWSSSLCSGGTLILAPRERLLPGPALHPIFERWQLTHLFASPTWLAEIEPPSHAYPQVVIVGGEAGIPQVSARWLVGRRHVNGYGPTEITVCCTFFNIEQSHLDYSYAFKRPLLLGPPLDHTQMYVIDRWGQPVLMGVVGELWVGGVGVTRGYVNRPGLTARQFVPDSFGSTPGARLYRTGDLVRMVQLETGQRCLDYIGRIDFQVKLRGQRIELSEIEAVLAQTEGVSRAVVQLQGHGETAALVAYLQTESEIPDPLALAKARLPQYMVPAHVVILDSFPTTVTGKLDLKALPQPGVAARALRSRPETPTEKALAQIWAKILGGSADGIGCDDNFFQLGGHSLMAVRLANQIRARFGMEMPLPVLFAHPTLRAQAAAIDAGESQGQSEILFPEIRVSTEPEVLSDAQSALWFLDQIEGSGGEKRLGGVYNIPAGWRVQGVFDVRVVSQALDLLVLRHPILRAAYPQQQGLPTVIQLPPERLALRVVDLQDLADSEAAAKAYVRGELERAFIMAEGPLFRATILRLAPFDQILFINQHHIISDGWSMGLLKSELMETYVRILLGLPLQDAVPTLQYRDFAHWQRRLREMGALDQQLAWWKTQLADVPPRVELPFDKPRPSHQTFHGQTLDLVFPEQTRVQLKAFNEAHRVTSFMTFHAVLALLLARLSGQSVICIGSPSSGRHHKALEPMLGMFVNTLAIPTRLQPSDTFASLVASVREQILSCLAHQDVGLDRVVGVVQPQRDLSFPPLFQVLLSVTEASEPEQGVPGTKLQPVAYDLQAIKFELEWGIVESPTQLSGLLGYNTDLFLPQTAIRYGRQLTQLLGDLIARPDQPWHAANLLTDEERKMVVDTFNANPQRPLPATTILHLFQRWAQTKPDGTALLFDPLDGGPVETCSYATLARESKALASLLQQRGAGPEVKIGLCIPPSLERMIGVLGVLTAGAAYVPIDPEYPADRISAIVVDSGLSLLLALPGAPALALPPGVETLVINRAELVDQTPREVVFSGLEAAYLIFTSGSTGKPKGIIVPHQGLVNLAREGARMFELTPESRLLQMASFSFDAAVLEWAIALGNGALLILAPRQSLLPGPHLSEVFARWQLSHLSTFPAWLSAMEPPEHEYPRVVFAGGEAGNPQVSARWLLGRRHFNAYGPTEATVICSALKIDETHLAYSLAFKRPLLLGRPLDHFQQYVVDRWGQPVSFGVSGELWVGGVGVTRGYHNRPGLTARQFVPDCFGALPGGRLYRTGDLVRMVQLDSGQQCLDFIGRVDFQVKLRGLRIEIGEIEAVLAETEGVTGVVVQLIGTGEAAALVAYLQAPSHLEDPLVLAKARLPQYMVPSYVVVLPAFPMTSSNKVDLKALPKPLQEVRATSVAPQTPTEKTLAQTWAQILGCAVVGIGRADDFFELGGHSLMAVRLANQIRTQFGIEMPVRELFAHPVLQAQAAQIDTLSNQAPSVLIPEPVPRTSPERRLSLAQNTLWFLDQLEGQGGSGRLGGTYNMPVGWKVRGPLDLAALSQALERLVLRHEILRSAYPKVQGGPAVILLPESRLALRVLDFRQVAQADQFLDAFFDQERHHCFDLGTGPLFRATIVWLSHECYALIINQHHIIADGWSMGLLKDQLISLYTDLVAGRSLSEPVPALDYWDYASWQHRLAEAGVLADHLAWWKNQLHGLPNRISFPLDKPRPSQQSFRGASTTVHLDAATHAGLMKLEHRLGLTSFMTLHAVLALVLSRHSGQNQVCIGSPVAGRNFASLEGIYGMFVSMMPVPHTLDPHATLESLLLTTRNLVLGCFAHNEAPFDQIVEVAQPERDMSHSPLFQVQLSLLNLPESDQLPGQVVLEPLALVEDQIKFELAFTFHESVQGRIGTLQYNADLYDAESMHRLARRFEQVAMALVQDPQQRCGRVSLVGTEDQALLAALNHDEVVSPPFACITDWIRAWVDRSPDALALDFLQRNQPAQALSYARLENLSNHLACELLEHGLRHGEPVGLCLPPSWERIVGLLAVLKAGGVYVPLDPEYPQERLEFIITDAGVSQVLTHEQTHQRTWPAGTTTCCLDLARWQGRPAPKPKANIDSLDDAYVIYTSGSTGTPKGVAVSHGSLTHFVAQLQEPFRVTPSVRFLQLASFNFDVSVLEWGLALGSGACLCLAPRADLMPDQGMMAALVQWQITHLFGTPTWLAGFDPEPQPWPQVVIAGGEAVPAQLAARWSQGRAFFNGYGPTENTILTTTLAVDQEMIQVCQERQRVIPLGKPFGRIQVAVLDRNGEPLPVGIPGELVAGGPGVARGYIGRPALTAERFVPDPSSATPGGRCYRTGDLVRLARFTSAVEIDYLGRIDHQVKLRGFRIELGEIEAALAADPCVNEAVALIHQTQTGNRFLVAYLTGACAEPAEREALLAGLKTRLPDYMVPTYLFWLEAFPIAGTGKVDRHRLAALVEESLTYQRGALVQPRTTTEHQLVAVWSELLGRDQLGVTQDFFKIGGHSLLAVKLASRIQQTFGKKLPVADLFLHSTIEAQAQLLLSQTQTTGPVVTLHPGHGGQPWFFVHPVGGQAHWYLSLARALGDSPVYAFQAAGLEDGTPHQNLDQMVACYLEALLNVQPEGPYRLLGWSAGGTLALELAHQLETRFHQPVEVVMLDAFRIDQPQLQDAKTQVLSFLADLLGGQSADPEPYLQACRDVTDAEQAWQALARHNLLPDGWPLPVLVRYQAVFSAVLAAINGYQPKPRLGSTLLIRACENRQRPSGWEAVPNLQIQEVPGSHYSILSPPTVQLIAEQLNRADSPKPG